MDTASYDSDKVPDNLPHTIRSRTELRYCPLCGSETEREERGYADNFYVECPEHGELLLD